MINHNSGEAGKCSAGPPGPFLVMYTKSLIVRHTAVTGPLRVAAWKGGVTVRLLGKARIRSAETIGDATVAKAELGSFS